MGRLVYGVATSLDGFVARSDGSRDWLPEDPGVDRFWFLGRLGEVVTGRRTFEVAVTAIDSRTRTFRVIRSAR